MTRQYLTYKQVSERVALARSSITRMVRQGRFPRPVPIGPHHVRFVEEEVSRWQAERESLRAVGGLL
jgi:prophage regulatory protein